MLSKLKDAARSVAGTVTDAAGTVGGIAASTVGAVAGTAGTVAEAATGAVRGAADVVGGAAGGAVDAAVGAGRAVRLAVEEKRLAVEAAVDDGVWAVRRPVEKVGSVAVGMVAHVAPVVLERAVDKLAERLFGSIALGPFAPIAAVIGTIETVVQLLEAIDEFNRLLRETDSRLDAAERARLEARRRDAEERLARLRPVGDPVPTGNGRVAAVVGGADDGLRFDVTVLEGRHAGRTLSELPRAEVEALLAAAPDGETERLIRSWLALNRADS